MFLFFDTVVCSECMRRGSQIIVIHPGSRSLRIGKASDVFPVTVPNVVARKINPATAAPPATFVEGIYRPRGDAAPKQEEDSAQNKDEYTVTVTSDDPVTCISLDKNPLFSFIF